MKTLRKLLVLSLGLTAAALISGCEGRYRYECQNPDNQGLPQCQPEVCGPSKTCFNDLNGVTPWSDFSEKQIEDLCTSTDMVE